MKKLLLLSILVPTMAFSQNLSVGFQSSFPSYGLSLKADFDEKNSAQAIFGAFGTLSSYSARYIYNFNKKPNDITPFAYAQAGVWKYKFDLLNINESVFGYGVGGGLEFNIFKSFLEGLKSSVELSYGSVDLEYYDFKATTFGFGIHYSL